MPEGELRVVNVQKLSPQERHALLQRLAWVGDDHQRFLSNLRTAWTGKKQAMDGFYLDKHTINTDTYIRMITHLYEHTHTSYSYEYI
jgi:acyl-CoA reductase-like NAD-dependent aldehyde dehydrogenase